MVFDRTKPAVFNLVNGYDYNHIPFCWKRPNYWAMVTIFISVIIITSTRNYFNHDKRIMIAIILTYFQIFHLFWIVTHYFHHVSISDMIVFIVLYLRSITTLLLFYYQITIVWKYLKFIASMLHSKYRITSIWYIFLNLISFMR